MGGGGGADAAECLEGGARARGEERVCGGGPAYLERSICLVWDVGREGAAARVRAAGETAGCMREGEGGGGSTCSVHAGTIHTIFTYHHPLHSTPLFRLQYRRAASASASVSPPPFLPLPVPL